MLSETTRVLFGANEGVSQLIFGAILVLGILFMPQGIIGLVDKMASPACASDRGGDRGDKMASWHTPTAAENEPMIGK